MAKGSSLLASALAVDADPCPDPVDQGIAAAALNKTVRTFTLGSGTLNSSADPVDKQTVIDLVADPFRMDQEKI